MTNVQIPMTNTLSCDISRLVIGHWDLVITIFLWSLTTYGDNR